MNIKQILIALMLFITSLSHSQNYLFVNDNQYESTEKWDFQMGSELSLKKLGIIVAKDVNQGYISLSIDSYEFMDNYFTKYLYLFLAEGKTIKLDEIVSKDEYDNVISVVYSLSRNDIEMLSKYNIVNIRFFLSRKYLLGGEETKSYSATNKRPYEVIVNNAINTLKMRDKTTKETEVREKSYEITPESFLTANDINQLFNQN